MTKFRQGYRSLQQLSIQCLYNREFVPNKQTRSYHHSINVNTAKLRCEQQFHFVHMQLCAWNLYTPHSCIIMSLWCMSASLEPMQAFRSRFCLAALEKKWRFFSKAVRQNLEQKAWVQGYECHCRTIISYCNVCEWPYWSSGILNLWNGSVITFQYIKQPHQLCWGHWGDSDIAID